MDDKHYLDYLEQGYKNKKFVDTYELLFRPYPEIHRINGLPIHFDPKHIFFLNCCTYNCTICMEVSCSQ